MESLRFDDAELIARLAKLPNKLRVAFAAACAQRQLPNYEMFSKKSGSGNPQIFEEALDSVWEDLQGRPVSDVELASTLEKCLSLIEGEKDDPDEDAAYADDAAASVAYAIRARLTGAPQEAAWAAKRAYEAIDHMVMNQFPTGLIGRDLERDVVSHPLVQTELRRQQADLRDLESVGTEEHGLAKVVSSLRDRARRDA
jgi:uncharacterized protein YjaG (DUF416 family)